SDGVGTEISMADGSSGGDAMADVRSNDAVDAAEALDGTAMPDSRSGGDAGPQYACTPITGVDDRAVVVTVNRGEVGDDSVVVYTLKSTGEIVYRGLEFGGFVNPRRVAIRPDGREAVVAYGVVTDQFGMAVISLEPDGSAAALEQNVVLGSGHIPFA